MLWNRQWQTTKYDADIIDVDGTYATGSTKFDAMRWKQRKHRLNNARTNDTTKDADIIVRIEYDESGSTVIDFAESYKRTPHFSGI